MGAPIGAPGGDIFSAALQPTERPPSETSGAESAGAVLGLDNIPLELPVAGVGSRILAAGVDSLVVALAAAAFAAIAFFVLPSALGDWRWAVLILGFFALDQGYFVISEIATRGRTLGKSAVGLRVVARDGGSADVPSFLLRNLLREIDVLVGVFFMALDPLARRLGDRLGGTLVIHEETGKAEVSLGRIPHGWGAREVSLAEALFARVSELEPDQSRFLARRLVAWVERDAPDLLAGGRPDADPLGALEGALLPRSETTTAPAATTPAGSPR
jgi:uncharacterized RDD family membrane protein YckC